MGYRDDFIEQGYVLLEGAIDDELLADLRVAVQPLHKELEAGKASSYRKQTVLKPDVFHRAYIDFLNLEIYNEAAHEILEDDDPMFSGQACLTGSLEQRICGWHRDFADNNPEMPELLTMPNSCIQTNCAIYDDESLWIIPGSHSRPTNKEERDYQAKFEGLGFVDLKEEYLARDESIPGSMPGAMHAKLKAGDCLLYNPFLWHAAEYRPEWKRATLCGGFKPVPFVHRFKNLRWGLPHNPWCQEPEYMGDLGTYFGPGMKHYCEMALEYPDGPA